MSGGDNCHLQVIILADWLMISGIHSAELPLAHSASPAAAPPGYTVSSSDSDANHLAGTCTTDTSPSHLEYGQYMSRLLASEEWTPVSSPVGSSTETSPTFKGKVSPALKLSLKRQMKRIYSKFFCPLCTAAFLSQSVHL